MPESQRPKIKRHSWEMVGESCIDRNIPLAMPAPFPRPEFGTSVGSYYAARHARGEFGRFYPLHVAQRLGHVD